MEEHMTRNNLHRALSYIERSWLSIDSISSPFVVQMVLEGRGSLDMGRLAAAVEQAAESNPGTRLVLKGALRGSRWVDSGRAPCVRVVSGGAWDGYGPENAPFLHDRLPYSGPTCEVLWVEGLTPRIIFRASHGVMDDNLGRRCFPDHAGRSVPGHAMGHHRQTDHEQHHATDP